MIVYIDRDYKCYAKNLGGYRSVNIPFFDGKCETFIEGFHFVPAGEKYKKETGEIITGPAIFPFKDLVLLETIQRQYEEFLVYKEEVLDKRYQEFLDYKNATEQRFRRIESMLHSH